MKVSLEWLSEYISLPNITPEKLAELIAEHCFEVEKIIYPSKEKFDFSGVVTAKVLDIEKHPNADRLQVVKVSTGKEVVYPIVCGAHNFSVGDIVALAQPGAYIPYNIHSESGEGFTLGTAKIRGIESQGMLCAGAELKLSEGDSEGILILSPSTPLGVDFAEHRTQASKTSPLSIVFEVALPANRPDLHSHLGIARELSAILGLKKKKAFVESERLVPTKSIKGALSSAATLPVKVQDKKMCARYSAYKLAVEVRPSPKFITDRLSALGIRSVNNIVDITNYVMQEVGAPLHAFNSAKVNGKIEVRSAKVDEQFTTLDHKQRSLDSGMLVIADENQPLAIAGIMGGVSSEVDNQTTEIILESAVFNPYAIRAASKKFGLRTDASALFEKGVSPEQAMLATWHALDLLEKYAEGQILGWSVTGSDSTPLKKIRFTKEDVSKVLGVELKDSEIKKALAQTGLPIKSGKIMELTVPYYRQDMINYSDIADEILRIMGPNKLVKKPPLLSRTGIQHDAGKYLFDIKEHVARLGYLEVQAYSFVSGKHIAEVGYSPDAHVKVSNPLSADQDYLRKDLKISLIQSIAKNAKIEDDLKLFEVGKGYGGFLQEPNLLGVARYNPSKEVEHLLGEVKGVVNNVLSKHAPDSVEYQNLSENTQEIMFNGARVGIIYVVNSPDLLNSLNVTGPIICAELNVDIFQQQSSQSKALVYRSFSKYPQKTLDISLIVSENTKIGSVESAILQDSSGLISDVELFEAPYLYASENLPEYHRKLSAEGKKNLAFHVVFQASDRTLTDSEILPIYGKIQERLKRELGAEIR